MVLCAFLAAFSFLIIGSLVTRFVFEYTRDKD